LALSFKPALFLKADPDRRPQERSVFIRERANGLYAPGHYHLATTLVSIPFLFVCALCYTLIM
jgi:hypothetical protein